MSIRRYSILILFFLISIIFINKNVFSQGCNTCPSSCQITCGQTLSGRTTNDKEYFNFTLSELKTVTITMTPSGAVDYNLYVKYTKDLCPSLSSYDCPVHYGMGIPETCTYNFPAGSYYIMVRYSGFTGTYDLSVNCGEATSTTTSTSTTSSTSTSATTSTSTTGSTTTSLITSTTSGTTSTSTTSLTTSITTTSTSTTSTVPLITLECKNNTIYVKQSSECNVTGCNKGYWLISNFEKNPLDKDILVEIPPNRISFGPTKESGKVMTSVICYTPYVMVNYTIDVIRGPNLICPETCYTGESCKCEVDDCKNGVYLMDNYEGDVLESDVIKDLTETTFSYEFTALDVGKIRVRMFCYDPYETKQETYINVSSQTITTTMPGEFQLSNVLCSKNECTINVNKNSMDEAVKIFVRLIKEPEGVIYYSGVYTTMPGSTGMKTTLLERYKTCVNGTDLKLLVTAYPYSNLNKRITRVKSVAFTC